MKRAFIYIFYYNLVVATLLLIGFAVQNGRVNKLVTSGEKQAESLASLEETLEELINKELGSRDALEEELTILREQVNAVRLNEGLETEVLGSQDAGGVNKLSELSGGEYLGTVTISNQYEMVDVHSAPLASSGVIGQAYKDLTYLYTSKQGQWYEIDLGDGTVGWVQVSLVKEN